MRAVVNLCNAHNFTEPYVQEVSTGGGYDGTRRRTNNDFPVVNEVDTLPSWRTCASHTYKQPVVNDDFAHAISKHAI